MIDQTTFDLRVAAHSTTVARVNRSAWRHSQPTGPPVRGALASTLVDLAVRLDLARTSPRRSPATLGQVAS